MPYRNIAQILYNKPKLMQWSFLYFILLSSLSFLFFPTYAFGFAMETGSYFGNGAPRSITGLDFQPKVVIIKGDIAEHAVWRSDTMGGDLTAFFANAAAHFSGGITSLESDGFSIGTSPTVNSADIKYFFVAFGDDGSGDVKTGLYTGNSQDDRSIALGFQPALVWIKMNGASTATWRSSQMSGDLSSFFDKTAESSNHIQSFSSDGLQIGSDARVNKDGASYHYVAFRASPQLVTNFYAGDGQDDRVISLGFQPDYLWIKDVAASNYARHRTYATSGGKSLRFMAFANGGNEIQSFTGDGVELGDSISVNGNGSIYRYVAWRDLNKNPKKPVSLGPVSKLPASAQLSFIFPVFNNSLVQNFTTTLRPYIRDNDIFQVGSRAVPPNMSFMNDAIGKLKAAFPYNEIRGDTANGLENLHTISSQILPSVGMINYNYEGGETFDPLFTTDFKGTLSYLQNASSIIRSYGKKSSVSPAGGPLLDNPEYGWNYGTIGSSVDFQEIQTQRYCLRSVAAFQSALNTLLAQYSGKVSNWAPQITVAPLTQPNGVFPEDARLCTQLVTNAKIPSLVVWLAGSEIQSLKEYLILVGRDPLHMSSVDLVAGGTTNDTALTLTFGIFDPDLTDMVRYRIQIDDAPNFFSPVIDYTSPFLIQGTASFTVGQTTGGEFYTIGSPNQKLADGSYYWRVKTIDQKQGESMYALASMGTPAFSISSGFAISQVIQPILFVDKENTLSLQGTGFVPLEVLMVQLSQNGNMKLSNTVSAKSDSTLELSFFLGALQSLQSGFYALTVESISGTKKAVYPKPLLITKLGDLWSPQAKEGDVITGDGKIDLYDVSRLLSKFGSTNAQDISIADINPGPKGVSQGKVDLYDANKLMANWTG